MKVLITTPTLDNVTLVKNLTQRPVRLEDMHTRDQLLELCGNPEYQAGFEWPNAALLFLKENVPSIDILNYPTAEEYETALAEGGYDAVGFSFYTISAPRIVEMADLARVNGVSRVWAGNFGATTPGYARHFDRVFVGHGEEQLKQIVEGRELACRKHPVMTGSWGWLRMRKRIGYLYTVTGCRYRCRFCPTANFAPIPAYAHEAGVYQVIDEYYRQGIDYVMIMDETFLQDEQQSMGVMQKLRSRDLTWHCVSRINLIKGRVKELRR